MLKHVSGVVLLVCSMLWVSFLHGVGIDALAPAGEERSESNAQAARADSAIDYVRQVRPILQKACYECHGPTKSKGQLRLHERTLVLKGNVSRPAVIVPGKSADSLLVQRILGLGDEDRMPLDAEPLSLESIDLIRAWIDQGAEWPSEQVTEKTVTKSSTHWAYVGPVRSTPPTVGQSAWSKNPVDLFILARLTREGLAPAQEAARPTLLRRVMLDLTGLPPSPAEIDAFVADRAPDAYERIVDRLLASPHYGERWARSWLDLARYADTDGYDIDGQREMWKFRDWVIKALNADMPFDQFTAEQIAGDMLPDATMDQIVASGFHRNAMTNREGGTDPDEALYEVLVDRVNTTATVWLGTTMACAQCHDHKHDPFSQKDYYRLLAMFQNTAYATRNTNLGTYYDEAVHEIATPEQAEARARLRAEVDRLREALAKSTPELEMAQAAWERDYQRAEGAWIPLRPTTLAATAGVVLTAQPDASILALGANPTSVTYTIVVNTTMVGITGLRLEALPDPSLPQGGPGRDPYGHFRLTGIEVDASPWDASAPAALDMSGVPTVTPLAFQAIIVDDRIQPLDARALFVRERRVLAGDRGIWLIDATKDAPRFKRQAVLIAERPFGFPGGTQLTLRLKHLDGVLGQGLGRFRLSAMTSFDPERNARVPARIRWILSIPAAERTPEQREQLARSFSTMTPLLKPTRDALTERSRALAQLNIPETLVMQDRPSFDRPSTLLRRRGNFRSPGTRVFAGVPDALHPMPESASMNRLGLARWLVDENNPLTARVTVNRFWEQLFGRGLVETSEDFGTHGSPPSHPELLDWLATEFMNRRWSQKALLRLLVTSATYRQDSRAAPQLLERDRNNILLARGPRFRLEAEVIRDLALDCGGLLDRTLHGPSVFPPQPDGIWNVAHGSTRWPTSTGSKRYRRSIYTFLRRTAPYPLYTTFDASSREHCTVRRGRTNTPLQALALLNDETFFEAAKGLSSRVLSDPHAGTTSATRATFAFRLVAAREPRPDEVARLLALYQNSFGHYLRHLQMAREVAEQSRSSSGDETNGAKVEGSQQQASPGSAPSLIPTQGGGRDVEQHRRAAEVAAWTIVANVLLNLDEVITKR
jgi:hypothetical protein